MGGPTKAQIEERLRQIEEENASLREQLDASRSRSDDRTAASAPSRAPRHRGRAALAIVLIVLGALLAPIATLTAFAARQAGDTEAFVDTLAPLAESPAIQALIVDEATRAIDEALDTDALVEELLSSIVDEGDTPRLADAADLLGPLLADQARVAIRSALTLVVESDAFATVWRQSLRLTHEQVVSVLEGDGDGVVAIADGGEVSLQLAPLIDELKPALVEAGFTLADAIPAVDASVTIADVPRVAQARLGYTLLQAVSDLLAWLALGALILGVVLHPRRPRALVTAGALLLTVGMVLGSALALGGAVAAAALATHLPSDATDAIYGTATGEIGAVMIAYALVGVIALLAGILLGGSGPAAAVRHSGAGVLGRGAHALDSRGWRPAGLAGALRRHPWLLGVWLGAIGLVLVLTLPPLTAWDVALGAAVLALAGAAYGVLRAEA